MDNRLSIHFVEDKAKTVLCASKSKIMKIPKLHINHKNILIKQHSKVTYIQRSHTHKWLSVRLRTKWL